MITTNNTVVSKSIGTAMSFLMFCLFTEDILVWTQNMNMR